VAVLSDMLDGTAARYFGGCSRTGRVLDPVADKIFVASVLGTLLWEGTLTPLELALIGTRDLVVMAGTIAGLALRRWETFRRMTPTFLGKATAAQFGFFVVLIAAPQYKDWVLPVTAGLSVLAGAHYLWLFVRNRDAG
jgi:cardiolipin synthase (CMP-forming)